jgi:UDP-glucose:(heptosyl)LPS alpha-1,3-glucosyltransferase
MNLALAIVNLFPGGGLQRDCLALARMLRDRGHSVTVFAAKISDGVAPDLIVECLPNSAWTNHGRNRRFEADLARRCAGRFDRVVGFDKMGGLDVLYCADQSVALHHAAMWRWLPRGRTLMGLEAGCFARGSGTRLLLLSARQIEGYRQAWGTESDRMTLLPPNLSTDRRQPQCRTDGTRQAMRASLGIDRGQWLWLAVGIQPQVKGMDRVVNALSACPDAVLLVAGIGEGSRRAQSLHRSASRQGVRDRVRFLGLRDDIPQVMAAADLLVHPARYETTGTVILEAIVNGLPVIATEACGYADHIRAAQAGIVVAEPFKPRHFIAALEQARDPARRASWSASAAHYGSNPDLFSGLGRAASIIVENS